LCACRIIVDQRIYRKGRIGIATIVDVRDQLVELQHKVVRTGLHEFRESSSAALAASHAEELEQVQMPFPSGFRFSSEKRWFIMTRSGQTQGNLT
jgi:hypothetical protein